MTKHFSIAAFQVQIDKLYEGEKGYYALSSLKFLLFEYEEFLRKAAKSPASKITWEGFRGERNSIEHIFPQSPEAGEWVAFDGFGPDEVGFLRQSLGNLVAVSVAKNASLSRKSFASKKKGTDQIPGFNQGSFSELQVAQYSDWTPTQILDRGLPILQFVEHRWNVSLAGHAEKVALLKLQFMEQKP